VACLMHKTKSADPCAEAVVQGVALIPSIVGIAASTPFAPLGALNVLQATQCIARQTTQCAARHQ